MANEITVIQVNPTTFEQQQVSVADQNVMTSFTLDGEFNQFADTVELYFYDPNQNLLGSIYDYRDWISYQNTNPAGTDYLDNLTIEPALDATQVGYYNGTVYNVYRFVKNKLGTSSNNLLYISDISSDRTEISLAAEQIDFPYSQSVAAFKAELDSTNYFQEFYLNFGDNFQLIGVNVRATDKAIQVKLYEPLPVDLNLKSRCWIQTEIADEVAYSVEFNPEIQLPDTRQFIAGPNLNLNVDGRVGNSTAYQNKNQIFANSASLAPQVASLLNEAGIEINIDYSNFENFVHFSTATQRLYNYYNKVVYLNDLAAATGSITIGGTSTVNQYASSSNDTIKNFDGYEYYLYFNQNLTSSAYVETWLGTPGWEGTGMLGSASRYDEENQDNLLISVPEFIREDSANDPYLLFVEMIGQYFDNLYLYTKAVSDKYNNDNRLNYGIAPEMVAEALRGFGVKLHQNNFSVDDLYTALIGLNPSGSIPFQSIQTGSLSFGEQYINQIVSASSAQIPFTEINQSTYKRIYHNLPLLVKKKGTLAGLQQLITTFGIPNTILRVYEFGGKDKDKNTWDYWQNTFSYCLTGSNAIATAQSDFTLNSNWNATGNVPGALAFKFNTQASASAQTIWNTENCKIVLTPHTPSVAPGTFTGQPLDPYYNYATASLFIGNVDKVDIFLPFYNEYWWTIGVAAEVNANQYTLLGGATTFNGTDGNTVNYYTQSSITSIDTGWSTSLNSYWQTTGSLQELRFYSTSSATSSFKDFIVNLDSTENYNYLAFRAALGGELFTGSVSIHPNQTISSFPGASNNFTVTGYYTGSRTTVFYDQPAVGIKNIVSQKIQITGSQAYGKVLSQYKVLEQPSRNYTEDVNYLEVGFSPTNEVNEEINNELGFFNIGEYIGDPALQFEDTYSYPDLDTLRSEYFSQYLSNYDITDYIRLISFFDNSLFKMVKDFIPAKSGAATGVIIKQNQLERNRQRQPLVDWQNETYSGSVKSFPLDYETGSLVVALGGPGGSVNDLQTSNQSWSGSFDTKAGNVPFIESSRYEFFNGEYSGSILEVINGELQDNPLLAPRFVETVADAQAANNVFSSAPFVTFDASVPNQTNGGTWTNFPFDVSTAASYVYNTTTYEYTPIYEVVGDLSVYITGSFIPDTFAGPTAEAFTLYIRLVETATNEVVFQKYFASGSDAGPILTNVDFEFNITVPDFTLWPGKTFALQYIGTDDGTDSDAFSFSTESYYNINVADLYAQSAYYGDPTVYSQQTFPGDLGLYDDYYALYGNVFSNRVSQNFYDVDYQDGMNYPVNYGLIMSQSAIYAQVQDSNYAFSSSWQRNRYAGIKLTGKKVNEYTAGDTSYGLKPVMNQETAYMIYYDWVGSTLAERAGSANYHIQYLIDETGTLYQPQYSSSFFYSMEQAFGEGAAVNITTYNAGSNNNTAVETTSYRPMQRLGTILYSSTGSLGKDYLFSGSYSSIGFSASAALLPYAELLDSFGTNFNLGPGTYTASFQTVGQDTMGGMSSTTYLYTHPAEAAPFLYTVSGQVEFDASLTLPAITGTVRVRILLNGTTYWSSAIVSLQGGNTDIITFSQQITLFPGDTIRIQPIITLLTDVDLVDNQLTIQPIIASGAVNAPYWTTGASSRNVLTSSVDLGTFYGGAYSQNDIPGSGFDTPLGFLLQRLDQIRFMSNENYVYYVSSVTYNSSTKRVYVYLHAPVPSTIDINNFSIRRLISDPGFIILNYQFGVGPGFIIPKYPSPLLKQNISKIIKDFAEKNLL